MTACVTGSTVKTTDLDYYDVRYFYFDREGNLGRYTCGIAREVMASLLREFRSAHFLSATWPANELLRNPTILGFVIEQQCLNIMMIIDTGILKLKTKHIDIKFHHARDEQEKCHVRFNYRF
jgi:hypothetical protein